MFGASFGMKAFPIWTKDLLGARDDVYLENQNFILMQLEWPFGEHWVFMNYYPTDFLIFKNFIKEIILFKLFCNLFKHLIFIYDT